MEPKTAPQKHFCLLCQIVNALWRIVLMRFFAFTIRHPCLASYRTCCERSVVRLRAALAALTLRRPCLFVNALWRIFLMRFGRSPSGILAFVRRRRLFLIKSSYKRTKLVFVRLEIDCQGNLSVCVCFSKPNSATMRKSGMTLYGALNSVLFFA